MPATMPALKEPDMSSVPPALSVNDQIEDIPEGWVAAIKECAADINNGAAYEKVWELSLRQALPARAWNPLVSAANRRGDIERLKIAAARVGVSTEFANTERLITAASLGHADCVAFWLEQGSNPRQMGASGKSALMEAAWINKLECVETLIPVSDIDARDEDGNSALNFAISSMNEDCALALIRAGADSAAGPKDFDSPPVYWAVLSGMDRLVEKLAKKSGLSKKYARQETLLDIALRREKWGCVDALCEADTVKVAEKALLVAKEQGKEGCIPRTLARLEALALADVVKIAKITTVSSRERSDTPATKKVSRV